MRPIFGKNRDPGVVEDLTLKGQGKSHPTRAAKENPLLAVHGPGPEGKRCGDCIHLFSWGDVARTYYKCELRRVSHSVATDHRVRWPACAKFEPAPEEDRVR